MAESNKPLPPRPAVKGLPEVEVKLPELKPTDEVAVPAESVEAPTPVELPPLEEIQVKPDEAPAEPPPPDPSVFEIRLAETSVQTGSIPITWCVDRDWLLQNSNKELFVLLATIPLSKGGDRAEWRGWARLSEMMAYITFYRPGKVRIVGIVTGSDYIRDLWMARADDKSEWRRDVLRFPYDWKDLNDTSFQLIDFWKRDDNTYEKIPNHHLDIELPSECFADEPSAAEKYWVNYFFFQKAVDQCEFRRRRMLAYTIQPLVFAIMAIFWTIAIIVTQICNALVGKWTTWNSFKEFDIKDRKDFLTVERFGIISWLFLPLPLLTTACLIFIKMIPWKPKMYLLWTPLVYLVAIPLITCIIFLLINIIATIGKWTEIKVPIWKAARRRAREAELKRLEEMRKTELESLELLLCTSPVRVRKIKDLPRAKRTVKLRFNGLKSLVCKPFAR